MNSVLGHASCFSNVESIPMLNGSNFSEWKEHLLLVLALMDLDISLREERPNALKHIEKTKHWVHSNRLSMMIMRIRIPPKFKGIVPDDVTTAKDYLATVEKCYAQSVTLEDVTSDEFMRSKEENESVREYIMTKMIGTSKIPVPNHELARYILHKLPSEFNDVKVRLGLRKDEFSTHELIFHCVLQEELIKGRKKNELAKGRETSSRKRTKYEE